MNVILEPLKVSVLTNMEAGQLMNRHLSDLATIDASLLTDAPYNNYVQQIGTRMELYRNALAQVQKSEETEKIGMADGVRDKAVGSFGAAIKLHAMSDIPEEVEASRSLGILFGTFKNIARLNYEAETLAIDKLTGELNSPAYAEKVNYLHMSKYVTRMAESNAAFKNLFGGRMVTTANTESFDMKTIRAEIQNLYNDFTDYVLAMAKATDNPLFPAALNLLNTDRKYYADQLARRTAPKKEEAKPSVN
jgi:hypothetical protein